MKDNDVFSGNEFNNFKEDNYSFKENFNVLENIKLTENFSTKENNEENKEIVKNVVEIKKDKKTFKFKDRIIESTAPLRTVVSAATCTVAVATAATTVFLSPAPIAENLKLTTGNDFVKYSLNINSLDADSSYKIQVTNNNFNYTEDINKEQVMNLEYIEGTVTNLRPNNRYSFKLLRDNGEIGGYSEFYTKDFYTLKAPNPDVLFNFEYDNDVLNYTLSVSDYYNICNDKYLIISDDSGLGNPIYFNDNEYSSSLNCSSNSDLEFNVFATIDGEEAKLGSYKYVFDSFVLTPLDNGISFTGHIGDKNKSIPSCSISFTTYDSNDNEAETFIEEIEDTSNINLIFNPTLEFDSYSFKLYVKDYILYQSDSIEFYTGPRPEFGEQYISNEGLNVICTNISTNSTGYIMDTNNNQISLKFYDDYFVIPLYDSLGNRYNYSNYKVNIDGHNYVLKVNKKLISVNPFSIYNINGKIYVHCNGYLSLYSNTARLKTSITYLGSEVGSFTFDETLNNYNLDIGPLGDSAYFSFTCIAVDENNNEVSDEVTQSSVPISDSIEINTVQNNQDFTLNLSSTYKLNYDIELLYYNNQNLLIKSEFAETLGDYSNNIKQYSATLPEGTNSIAYRILISGQNIYTSESDSKIIISQTPKEITQDGLVVYATGLNNSYSGTIIDSDNVVRNVIIKNDSFIIPIINPNTGGYIYYNDYTVTFKNSFQTQSCEVTNIEDMVSIENVRYDKQYSDASLKFDIYMITNKADYSIVIDAYTNNTLETSETIEKADIMPHITCLSSYFAGNNQSQDSTIKIYVKDTNENRIGNEYDCTLNSENKFITSYSCDSPNPTDVLVTYNADRTLNLYIPINFQCDDSNVYARVYLNDEYYDTQDKCLVVENYKDTFISLRYEVIKKSTNIISVFKDTSVSGGVNESIELFADVVNETDGLYAYISVGQYVDYPGYDSSKVSFENHPDATYDADNLQWKVKLNEEDTKLVMHFYCGETTYESALENINQIDPNIEIKGTNSKEWVLIINLE